MGVCRYGGGVSAWCVGVQKGAVFGQTGLWPQVAVADGQSMGHAGGAWAVWQVLAVVPKMGQAGVALAVRSEAAVGCPARRAP